MALVVQPLATLAMRVMYLRLESPFCREPGGLRPNGHTSMQGLEGAIHPVSTYP